jgi:Tol biopolymer transport system component
VLLAALAIVAGGDTSAQAGATIAFQSQGPTSAPRDVYGIYTMGSRGEDLKRVSDRGHVSGLGLSPTGDKLAYSMSVFNGPGYGTAASFGDVYVQDLATGAEQMVYQGVNGGNPAFRNVRFTPDGSHLLGAIDGIYSMRTDGTRLRELVDFGQAGLYYPTMSSTGKLAFLSDRTPAGDLFGTTSNGATRLMLYIVDFEGAAPRLLTDPTTYDTVDVPTFRPDGSRVAFPAIKKPDNFYRDFDLDLGTGTAAELTNVRMWPEWETASPESAETMLTASGSDRIDRVDISNGRQLFHLDAWDVQLIRSPQEPGAGWGDPAVGNPPPGAPPETKIDAGPAGATTDSTPTFAFSSSEAGSTFYCRVDGAPFTACASPFTTSPLTGGGHTFQVRAVDAAGATDPSPASRSFSVDSPPVEAASAVPPGRYLLKSERNYVRDRSGPEIALGRLYGDERMDVTYVSPGGWAWGMAYGHVHTCRWAQFQYKHKGKWKERFRKDPHSFTKYSRKCGPSHPIPQSKWSNGETNGRSKGDGSPAKIKSSCRPLHYWDNWSFRKGSGRPEDGQEPKKRTLVLFRYTTPHGKGAMVRLVNSHQWVFVRRKCLKYPI